MVKRTTLFGRLAAMVTPTQAPSAPTPEPPTVDRSAVGEPVAEMDELEQLQRAVTLGQLADRRRHQVICELHRSGVTQVDLAERLSKASIEVGGPEVGLDAVQKIWSRYRYKTW